MTHLKNCGGGGMHVALHAAIVGYLALRLVRAAPTGAQRFRVGGLFVVAEKGGGGGYETEYRWTVPHDRRI